MIRKTYNFTFTQLNRRNLFGTVDNATTSTETLWDYVAFCEGYLRSQKLTAGSKDDLLTMFCFVLVYALVVRTLLSYSPEENPSNLRHSECLNELFTLPSQCDARVSIDRQDKSIRELIPTSSRGAMEL